VSTVLVTGGSGRLGRYVVAELAKRHTVVNGDLRAGGAGGEVQLDVMDLRATTDACREADVVVHLAALDFDTHAASDDFIRVNTLGTWNVLEACAASQATRVVVCSSVAAFGLDERRLDWTPRTLPVDETHPARPAEPYSVSKQVMEIMTESFVRRHLFDVLCVRPVAIVFDEEVDVFLDSVDESMPSFFAYITAPDVARAIALGLEAEWSGYECVLLSAADSAHTEPTLDWYQRLVGPLPDVINERVFAANPRASVYSNARACSLLGWTPASDFGEIRSTGHIQRD
jgi:nucleoside-diphosphate-sugar epimerase